MTLQIMHKTYSSASQAGTSKPTSHSPQGMARHGPHSVPIMHFGHGYIPTTTLGRVAVMTDPYMVIAILPRREFGHSHIDRRTEPTSRKSFRSLQEINKFEKTLKGDRQRVDGSGVRQ